MIQALYSSQKIIVFRSNGIKSMFLRKFHGIGRRNFFPTKTGEIQNFTNVLTKLIINVRKILSRFSLRKFSPLSYFCRGRQSKFYIRNIFTGTSYAILKDHQKAQFLFSFLFSEKRASLLAIWSQLDAFYW